MIYDYRNLIQRPSFVHLTHLLINSHLIRLFDPQNLYKVFIKWIGFRILKLPTQDLLNLTTKIFVCYYLKLKLFKC